MMVLLFIVLAVVGTLLAAARYREGYKCLLWAGTILLSGFDFWAAVGIYLLLGLVLGPIFIALK